MDKDISQKLLKIFFLIILGIVAIINVGTVLCFIPILGEIATLVFIPTYKLNMIITVFISIVSSFYLYKNKGKNSRIIFAISLLILICFIIISTKIIIDVNNQGEDISLIKIFEVSNFSNVKVDETYYIDQNGKEIGANVYYVEDNVKNKPIMIYIHGGGWISGSKDNHTQMNEAFAKNGYVVISLDYELSTKENNYWDFTEKQLFYGFLWGKENASKYNGDISKVYMIGDSAGGNLVLNLSYKINNGEYDKINEGNLSKINAISVIYPVIDLTEFYNNNNSIIMRNLAKDMATSYIGGTPNKYSERYTINNPENYITDKVPPTLIVLGEQDTLVAPETTYNFIKKLDSAKIKNKLVKIPYGNHAGDISIKNFMGQTYINNTLEWFNNYKN